MRKFQLVIILLVLAYLWLSPVAVLALPHSTTNQQLLKAAQVNNYLHHIHPDAARQLASGRFTQAVTGIGTANMGSISGTLDGLFDRDYELAYVEAWMTKTDPASSDSVFYNYGISSVDSTGYYIIQDLSEGEYIVMAHAEGYEIIYYKNTFDLSMAHPVLVFNGQITEGINLTMQKIKPGTGNITGTVTALDDGSPIVDAFISIYSPDQPFWYSATSDEAGHYTLSELHSGDYIVQIWAEGFLEQYYNNKTSWFEADKVHVPDSTTINNINFNLRKAGSIEGTVTDKTGKPISGASVYAHPYVDSTQYAWEFPNMVGYGFTDDNGHYTITNLPSGQYNIHVEVWLDWTWAEEWYNNKTKTELADPVTVVEGIITTGIDFELDFTIPDGVIYGRVTDSEGHPVADAWISTQPVDYTKTGYGYAVTDLDGNYRITSLPDGFYYVSAGAQNGWQYVNRWWPNSETFEGAVAIEVGDINPSEPVNFTLPLIIGTSSIAGHVQATNGHPLAGASINISPASSNGPSIQAISTVWAWASTDSNGNYSVGRLPEGDYLAQASYWENDSYGQQWWDNQDMQKNATVITLAKNQNVTGINFSMNIKPMYGSISGIVTDSLTGLPVERAYIEISPVYDENWKNDGCFYWNNMYAITDKNGAFIIDQLYEGNYLVSVYANGAFEFYENAPVIDMATHVQVIGGERTEIAFDLKIRHDGSGEINGRVVSEGEKTPFDIAVVTAKPAVTILQWPQSEMFYTAITDSLGHFSFTGLPVGVDFYIYAFANSGVGKYYNNVYDPAQATLVKANGTTPTVLEDIELPLYRWYEWDNGTGGVQAPGNAQVVGTVNDGSGNAIVGSRIIVFNEASQAIASTQTHSGGAYEIGGLAPGKYVLLASHPGHNSAFNGNVATKSQAQMIVLGNGTLQIDFILSAATGIHPTEPSVLPDKLTLLGNYPNPFNPETRIVFAVPKKQFVQLSIYNLAGELVTTLLSTSCEPGEHQAVWNGRDASGRAVSSGVYMYRFESEEVNLTGKMLLMK